MDRKGEFLVDELSDPLLTDCVKKFSKIYLDYNATSPLSPSVLEWLKCGDFLFANPASQHSHGKLAKKMMNQAKNSITGSFKFHEDPSIPLEHQDDRLLIHSGATEAFVTFAHSFFEFSKLKKKKLLICFSEIDHPAVTQLMNKNWGPHVSSYLLKRKINLCYDFDFIEKDLLEFKKNEPDAIILYHHLWVHNETGFVSPLEDLSRLRVSLGENFYIHVDAVQAPGKIRQWQTLKNADIYSFSSHKMGALKGCGFSFFRSSLPFLPLMTGGGQQENLRSGTENTMGVIATSLALKDLQSLDFDLKDQYRNRLVKYLSEKLSSMGAVVDFKNVASNTIYFYFKNLSSDFTLTLFDLHGIELSPGSACASGASKDSLVLKALNLHKFSRNGLRMSLPFTMNENLILEIESRLDDIFSKLEANP